MNINANTDAGVRVFQPLPDDLSKAEQIDYTIGALIADMRFALLEIAKLREENHAMQQLLDAGKAQQILVSPATPSTGRNTQFKSRIMSAVHPQSNIVQVRSISPGRK